MSLKVMAVGSVLILMLAVGWAAFAMLPLGWMFMLLVGGLHSEFAWPTHTVGFWPAVGIMFALVFILKAFATKLNAEVK